MQIRMTLTSDLIKVLSNGPSRKLPEQPPHPLSLSFSPRCIIISGLWVAGEFKLCCGNIWPKFTLEISPAGQEAALVQKCCFLSNLYICKDVVCLLAIYLHNYFKYILDSEMDSSMNFSPALSLFFHFLFPLSSSEDRSDHGTM